jgi:hypothetical protein
VSLCVFASDARAESIGITVLDSHYSTDLSTGVTTMVPTGFTFDFVETIETMTATSGLPITDDLQASARVFARATADAFSVTTSTSALPDLSLNETSAFAVAMAETVLRFAPVQDGLATLAIDFVGVTLQSVFSEGLVSLFDVTTNQTLWAYQWDYPFEGNIPFTCCYQAALSIEQPFLASHQYAFTMRVGMDASIDEQSMSIRTSGLYAVPEPSSSSLLLVGVALIVVWRHPLHT